METLPSPQYTKWLLLSLQSLSTEKHRGVDYPFLFSPIQCAKQDSCLSRTGHHQAQKKGPALTCFHENRILLNTNTRIVSVKVELLWWCKVSVAEVQVLMCCLVLWHFSCQFYWVEQLIDLLIFSVHTNLLEWHTFYYKTGLPSGQLKKPKPNPKPSK